MQLKNNYYKINSSHSEADSVLYHVTLLPGCEVYRGHFPGHPVCPGVCNIQMLKECVEDTVGRRLFIDTIKQCRLTAVASPDTCRELGIDIHFLSVGDGRFSIAAKISGSGKTYMEYKGDMVV